MTDNLLLQQSLSGESSKAHQAYLDYRDFGYNRSLRKLHTLYNSPMDYTLWQDEHGRELPPKSPPTTRLSTIETWSSKFKWQKRIEEWSIHLQIERERQNERDRIEARAKRKSLLDSAIEKLEDAIEKANLQNDVPQFRAMIYGLKNVMVLSMQHHNDLPVERKDLTSKDKAINVNFITEPVAEDEVRNRLEELGLADFVEDQIE